MTPIEKAAIAALPAITAMSPDHGIAMGLGLLGGWLASVGSSIKDKKPWPEIGRGALVMLLFSIGSVLTTLFLAELTGASVLGTAIIAFAVGFRGEQAFELVTRYVFAPMLSAARRTDSEDKAP